MVREAEAHAEEDRRQREEAGTRNSAEQLVYSTEKFISDNTDKLPADGREKVQAAIADLKKSLEGTDLADVKTKHEALAKACQELGSAVHAAANGHSIPTTGFYSTAAPGGLPPRTEYLPPDRPVGQKIFISYRQSATGDFAGRLAYCLRDAFGRENVFFDVDSVRPGADYQDTITTQLRQSAVVLTPISDQWLDATYPSGLRRFEDPDDTLLVEIKTAFALKVRVIPILVNGAEMPRRHQLPREIGQLSALNAVHIRPRTFTPDAEALIWELLGHLGQQP